jgi:hypothetical protein
MPDAFITTAAITASAVLGAIAYLMLKHAIADFFLQTATQRREKGIYGARGGFSHAATHVVLTAPVFLMLPYTAALALALMAAEFALHYHIDYAKEQFVRRNGWTSHDTPFWWAIGLDQLLHGLTYVGIVWAAVLSARPF